MRRLGDYKHVRTSDYRSLAGGDHVDLGKRSGNGPMCAILLKALRATDPSHVEGRSFQLERPNAIQVTKIRACGKHSLTTLDTTMRTMSGAMANNE